MDYRNEFILLTEPFVDRFEEDPYQMPAIMQFTSECTREKEWDSIAAIHGGLVMATTWSFHKNKMGDLKLVPEQFQNRNRKDFLAEATCLALTYCGNFVMIGEFSLIRVPRDWFFMVEYLHRRLFVG